MDQDRSAAIAIAAETTGRKQRAGWPKGTSGNPKGRPKGSRHTALLALDAIGAKAAAAVLKKVAEAAQSGDLRAADILLRRVWPERKGRIVEIDLPAVDGAGDLPKALSAVMAAMAAGEITPDEASAIAAVIESKRKVVETADLDRRLTALESAANEGRRR
jgi:hypothetical protein